MQQANETLQFERIKQGDIKAFENLFHTYYAPLSYYAARILNDDILGEEIVQDFFVSLWEKREQISVEISVKNYLFRSIKNQCLNLIKHNKIKERHTQKILSENNIQHNIEEILDANELSEKIEQSINELPDKRKEIFRLSREEGLKYREIAEKLNISIKTVETQMSLAIKHLREKLKNINSILLFFYLFS